MKHIILCDENPLEFVMGRHRIEYVIEDIPSDEIYIIYNIFLYQSNLKETILTKCKTKPPIRFHFSQIDYRTRGIVETAFVGIRPFIDNIGDDKIVFIDIRPTATTEYSFDNVKTFLTDAKTLLDNDTFVFSNGNTIKNKNIKNIKNKLRICFDLDNTLLTYPAIAGDYSTVKPIYNNLSLLKKLKSDGHEIIIYTARRMKTHHGNVGKVIKDIAGITIDTLERFNIEYDELIFGKPIADIYIDDRAINPYINDLSYFGLFYDKDIDVDDKDTANAKAHQYIPNKIRNNKYNKIRRCDDAYIVKTGPIDIMKGELFYYQNIPSSQSGNSSPIRLCGLEDYFPRLIDYSINVDTIDLKMDYIEGIPLYYLYKNCILTHRHIDELFDILERLHTHEDTSDTIDTIVITYDNVKNNYIKKLKNRFNKQDYPFEDAEDVFRVIIEGIEAHFSPILSPVIHGDFWFSNIILKYGIGGGEADAESDAIGGGEADTDNRNRYKLLDMRGMIDDILTLNGDIYYDYGKLYQSILGYDLVLNGDTSNANNESIESIEYIQEMKTYFLQKCSAKGLNIDFLTYITKGLVFGTLPFISHYDNDVKKNVWDFIKSIK
jgi:capsule biosynthesis phosphatase